MSDNVRRSGDSAHDGRLDAGDGRSDDIDLGADPWPGHDVGSLGPQPDALDNDGLDDGPSDDRPDRGCGGGWASDASI